MPINHRSFSNHSPVQSLTIIFNKMRLLCVFVSTALLICAQGQQLSQKTFRKKFLEGFNKCSDEFKPPSGIAVTFFTSPELTDQNSKCFSMCLLNKFNLMDLKGNFKKEAIQQFLNSIPQSRFRSSLERNLDNCLQENSKDPCDKGYKFVQCFYRRAISSSAEEKPGNR